jgi:hypothetical protein
LEPRGKIDWTLVTRCSSISTVFGIQGDCKVRVKVDVKIASERISLSFYQGGCGSRLTHLPCPIHTSLHWKKVFEAHKTEYIFQKPTPYTKEEGIQMQGKIDKECVE